ncbi:MAG TPA: oxalate:formate antiporter [Candidatus Limnocylindria bacterium]|jgi:hypothetical protein|nr:oxalate:formate antiporter [Candidatus Limnocylindria bacterium]
MTQKKSSPVLIALAWLIVLVPLAWGFRFTLQKAVTLFTTTATAGK